MDKSFAQVRRAIEREFDEPFEQVIIGFVEMKFSQRLIAQTLELPRSVVRNTARRAGICFARQPLETIPPRPRSGRPPKLIQHQGRTQSISAWARELGVSPSTICRRLLRSGSIT